MKISLDTFSGGYSIHGYAPGEIRVKGPVPGAAPNTPLEITVLRRSALISPEQLITEWPPQSFEELQGSHFEALEELQPEVVLLGSGAAMRLPSPPLLASLIRLGVGYEVMDTGAACRTFNVLASEGRRVAAALLIC